MRPVAVALVLVACGGHPVEPPHRIAPPAAPARDPDLMRMPDDVWAIGAIDLVETRDSTARRARRGGSRPAHGRSIAIVDDARV